MNVRRCTGFTLIELLLAISIIVMVASMIVPMVSALSGGSLVEQSVNEVKGYLLMGQQQAVQYHEYVAVFFLPPTELTQNSRMMVFNLKKTLADPHSLTTLSNWRAMTGAQAAHLRSGIEVRNRGSDSVFCIIYNPNGYVDNRCPAENLSIRIQPSAGIESPERARALAINRATGTILQLSRSQ